LHVVEVRGHWNVNHTWNSLERTAPEPLCRGVTAFGIINIMAKAYRLFIFIYIMAKPKTDIFSICVFNNIMGLTCIGGVPLFPPLSTGSKLNPLSSMTYKSDKFAFEKLSGLSSIT